MISCIYSKILWFQIGKIKVTDNSPILLNDLFIWKAEWKREIQEKQEVFCPWFYALAGTGPGWSQEPAILPGSPT